MYRLMQLQMSNRKFKISQGIAYTFGIWGSVLFDVSDETKKISEISKYELIRCQEGITKIKLYPSKEEEEEMGILLIIDNASYIKTDGEKIAGIYSCEGVFLLKEGERIQVGKTKNETIEFAVIKYEEKMYLIELHEEKKKGSRK